MEMAPPNEACVEILHRGHCFRQEVKWYEFKGREVEWTGQGGEEGVVVVLMEHNEAIVIKDGNYGEFMRNYQIKTMWISPRWKTHHTLWSVMT